MPRLPELSIIRNLVLIGCAVAAFPAVRKSIHSFANSDAFADMRKDQAPTGTYLMRMEGVRLRHYSATQLVTYAHCDSVDISPDRRRYDLTGVHEALYRGKQGEFHYSADRGVYFDALNELSATGHVRIANQDLDLVTDAMRCDGRKKDVKILGRVDGRLRGGTLVASHVDYNFDTGAFLAGPVMWKGVLSKAFPEFREVEQALLPTGGTGSPQTSPTNGQKAGARITPPKNGAGTLPGVTPAQDPGAKGAGKGGGGSKGGAGNSGDDAPTVWEIQGETVESSGGDMPTSKYTNAVATDGEIILIAPTVVHDRKSDIVTAKGRIQYFSAKADIVADDCVIYRKEKRAVLTGHVVMYVKAKKDQDEKPKIEKLPAFQPQSPESAIGAPPPKITEEAKKQANDLRDNKTVRDFPAIVISEKIEYWYGKGARRAVITGSPQARQELPQARWRLIWTNVGYYDGERETLKMVSSKDKHDTRMKNSIGDDVTAEWMLVSTKEDDDSMKGHDFAGSLVQLDNDDVPDRPKPTKPGAAAKTAVVTPPAGRGTGATPPGPTPPGSAPPVTTPPGVIPPAPGTTVPTSPPTTTTGG